MSYVVRHPNFDQYLRIFDKPITRAHSEDDMNVTATTHTHEWVKAAVTATLFKTEEAAREAYTSPLCRTIHLKA